MNKINKKVTFLQQLCSERRTLGLPFQLEMFDGGREGSDQGGECALVQVLALQRKHGGRLALAHCGRGGRRGKKQTNRGLNCSNDSVLSVLR